MPEDETAQVLKGKRVALGVTGGIAAYKAAEILRGLQRAGCTVRVAMTGRACEFITPLTFRALSGSHVIVDDYAPDNPDPIAHITFSQTIELLLIAPATANIIAKFAAGIADDFLTSTYLAANAPVLLAPAMNTTMWNHPATRRNLERLRADGVRIVEPDAGEMACGTFGPGRLSEPEIIVAAALKLMDETAKAGVYEKAGVHELAGVHEKAGVYESARKQDLLGERVLITAGATREAIDPVRFLSNHSSGRMGFALAEAARARGAQVTVVAGATTAPVPEQLRTLRAVSAEEMRDAVMRELDDATIFIASAAVSDYRPLSRAAAKIKKTQAPLTLTLEPTPDILAEVAARRHSGLLVVGFAAETNDVINYARAKLERKKLDAIVANDITREGAGFDAETNAVTILSSAREAPVELPLMTKREAAHHILDEIARLRTTVSVAL